MQLELRHLRNFLHLAETLSFSRGAERAHISQSSMTEQIQRLEDVVGVRLVDRNRRHVRLTLAGETLRQQARSVLDSVDQVVEATRRAGGVVRDQLRVGYSEMALSSAMPGIIQRFRLAEPHTDTILLEQSSVGAEQKLLDHVIDCAFVPGSQHHPDIAALEIGNDQVLACIAANSPLARHSCLTIKQISHEPLILPSKGNRFGDSIIAAFARADIEPRIVARINRASAILTLVAAEEGAGFIPLSLAGLVPPGVLVRPFGRPQLAVAFSLLWRRAQTDGPVARMVEMARAITPPGTARPRGRSAHRLRPTASAQ